MGLSEFCHAVSLLYDISASTKTIVVFFVKQQFFYTILHFWLISKIMVLAIEQNKSMVLNMEKNILLDNIIRYI